jgi:membrane protein YqaA with SNARE-associated domain
MTENKPGLHRRLYNWVIHWADTPYALPALIILSFAESSFFPIPPDVLLLPLCLGEPRRAFKFAAWCSVASVAGGMAGYWLGFGLWHSGLDRICFEWIPGFTPTVFERVSAWYDEYNFLTVFIAGFSPLPYKVFTIAAGVFGINFLLFVLASAVSRSGRFFLEAWLLRKFGPSIRDFIEKRLGLMALLFCVGLVGGFVAIKYLI